MGLDVPPYHHILGARIVEDIASANNPYYLLDRNSDIVSPSFTREEIIVIPATKMIPKRVRLTGAGRFSRYRIFGKHHNYSKFLYRLEEPDNSNDVLTWIDKHTSGEWSFALPTRDNPARYGEGDIFFYFMNEEDATLFKLKWNCVAMLISKPA